MQVSLATARPATHVGELIEPGYAHALIHGYRKRFPGTVSLFTIPAPLILETLQGPDMVSGIRFMYGLETAGDPRSAVLILVPCNMSSVNKLIPNSIIQPQGYLNHRGERVSLKQTWEFLYQHAVYQSSLEPDQPFHRIVRGAFFGIHSLTDLLTIYGGTKGIQYHIGYDGSEETTALRHKPVLIPVNAAGEVQELYMDISRPCPPLCDCDKPGYPPCNECLITDLVASRPSSGDPEKELDEYRRFRDQQLRGMNQGPLVEMYYYVSPALIEAISATGEADKIYADIYSGEVQQCHALINKGYYAQAKDLFENTIARLMKTYLFQKG